MRGKNEGRTLFKNNWGNQCKIVGSFDNYFVMSSNLENNKTPNFKSTLSKPKFLIK